MVKPPYLRLSLYYFFFFAALGAFVPYWSVYLDHLGFNAVQIGQLMAVFMVSKMLAPLMMGWMADHVGRHMLWIRLSSLLTVFGFMPVLFDQQYLWLFITVAVGSFFWNASMPQFEAVTLNYLGKHTSRYSWIRLWGSIGFIGAVLLLPYLFAVYSLAALPVIMVIMFALMTLVTLTVADKSFQADEQNGPQDLWQLLRHPMVMAFLAACILQSLSHGAYYTFFTLYLEDHGYSRTLTGWLWALGVIAEVILFIFLYRLYDRYQSHQMFATALLLTALRWLLLAYFVDSLAILFFIQILHAASFGLFHATAIHLIHEWFPGGLQGRGQALYAGLSFGLGGAIGSMMSGYLWEYTSSVVTFNVMALAAFIGWMLVWKYIRSSRLW